MKHQAFAPELRFGQPEAFALVPERGVDHDAHQRLAAQKLRHRAEADLHQLRLESGKQENRNEPAEY